MSQPSQKTGFWREFSAVLIDAPAKTVAAKAYNVAFNLIPILWLILSDRQIYFQSSSVLVRIVAVLYSLGVVAIYSREIHRGVKANGFRTIGSLQWVYCLPAILILSKRQSDFFGFFSYPWNLVFACLLTLGGGTLICYANVLRHRRPTGITP